MKYLAVFIAFAFSVGCTLGTTPPPPCPNENEVSSNCDELTCETRFGQQNCTNQYWTCICKSGYVRDGSGLCIPKDDCHFCPRDEKYVNCVAGYCKAKTCDDLGYPLDCPKVGNDCEGGCVCIDGYVRNCAGICIPGDQCPSCGGDENARPGCGTHCGNSCSDYKLRAVILCPMILCIKDANTCICRENYVYDATIKKCVLPKNCPGDQCGENESYDECKKKCVCKEGYERKEGTCVKKCGCNEHWTNCTNPCPKLPKGAVCKVKCIAGCICDSGYIRKNDKCVKRCPKNEHPCNENTKNCVNGCACDKGYRRQKGVCTKIVCGKHEHYSPCINPCPKGAQCLVACIEGCLCDKGYERKGDVCVKKSCGRVTTVEKETTSSSSSASEHNSDESSRSEYSKVKNADGSYSERRSDEENSSSSSKEEQSESSSTKTTITSRPADDKSPRPPRGTNPPAGPPPGHGPAPPGPPTGPRPGTNPVDCGPLEEYLEQTNECQRSCADLKPSAPPSLCPPSNGCFCKSGYVRRDRNGSGPCVPVDSCPQ